MRIHGPGDAAEHRRGEVERIEQSGAQHFKLSGEVEVVGVGEAGVSLTFPVIFTDKPAFSFGPALDDGQAVTVGNLPNCSVVVVGWHERVRDDGTFNYVGAQLTIVTTGPSDQVMLVQWHMEGTALRGPVDDGDES